MLNRAHVASEGTFVSQERSLSTLRDGGDAMADTGAVQEQLEQLLPQVCINQINAIAKSKRACRRVHNDTKRNFVVSDMPFGSR